MWQLSLQIAFLALYAAILLVISVYGVHRYILVWLYVKNRHKAHVPADHIERWPLVTVQLPMYNEDRVAERVIAAACRIDYPRDRLQIQVLDDSTDHSGDLARAACERWAAEGYPVEYVHRTNRHGYKAGALAEGLGTVTGEYVAIFDADFVPPPDILKNVVPHFTDPNIGMVQVRWAHLNRDASLLTKGQAIFLDGHFVIEHTARNRSGRFMHFNGTAGVWRRQCIDDAGGWQHDTLTEDLDLSYRAQLKGWQFVYLPQFSAPAELPPEILAFKQQAHRWTKGSFQTAKKLLPGILRSKTLSWRVKAEAFFHLTCTIAYPLMVLLTITIYPAFIVAYNVMHRHPLANWMLGAGLFVIATCSAGTFFVYAQRELFGKKIGWQSVLYLPFVMALGVGMGLNNTKAVIEAIFTNSKSRNEFVRTPKYGVTGKRPRANLSAGPAGVRRGGTLRLIGKLGLPVVEIAFGLYLTCFILFSVIRGFAVGSVPFLLIFAAGYYYVGFTSIWVLFGQWRDARRPDDVPDVLPA